jgi:hypothetical protein
VSVHSIPVVFTMVDAYDDGRLATAAALALWLRDSLNYAQDSLPGVEPRRGPGGAALDGRVGGDWIDEFHLCEDRAATGSDNDAGVLLFAGGTGDVQLLLDAVMEAQEAGLLADWDPTAAFRLGGVVARLYRAANGADQEDS